MTQQPSIAERLDRAVDQLLSGGGMSPLADRALLDTAASVRAALPVPVVSSRFEARVGTRLAATSPPAIAWALRHPGRLIVTGAVGSAVGVGVTAFAVWRSTRRTPAHRLLHR